MMTKLKTSITYLFQTPYDIAFYIYLIIYSILSSITLSLFPTVHSDEIWLGSLSQSMLRAKSLFTTETFFDLFPRSPHTMKILFHALQGFIINFWGLSLFNLRLISLIFAILTLIILYSLLKHINHDNRLSLLICILTSVSTPYIYASHFARQEMILVFILVSVYYIYIKNFKYSNILVPLIIGITISFHPNAFILACMIALILCKDILTKKKKLQELIIYILTLAVFAAINIIISISQNNNFINDYIAYGKTLSVTAAPSSRIANFLDFYLKSYYQISGSYYIPPMKIFIIGTVLVTIIATAILFFQRFTKTITFNSRSTISISNGLLLILGFNAGLFIIGRYNTTSIVFMLVPVLLLLASVITYLSSLIQDQKKTFSYLAISLLIIIFTYESYSEIDLTKDYDYSSYEEEISSHLLEDSIVLGNLSSGFAFVDIPFKDIRNLEYLQGESVYNYLLNNSINTIIYYEEYDYIHRNQKWEILYGDDSGYYDELNDIILNYGTLIHTFEDKYYGSRIIRYMGDYPWKISIYRLDLEK